MDSSSKSEDPPAAAGILGSIGNIVVSVRRAAANLLELFTFEIRRAGQTLMWLVALGAVAALLIITAWFGLMAALVLWIVSLGVTWAVAIAAIALLNLLVAGLVIVFCVRLSRNLLFPATRRQLNAVSSSKDSA